MSTLFSVINMVMMKLDVNKYCNLPNQELSGAKFENKYKLATECRFLVLLLDRFQTRKEDASPWLYVDLKDISNKDLKTWK